MLGKIQVREALRLTIRREGRQPGTLLFLHGHQGTADSDRWGWASRLFVRYVWRPLQRRTGFSATTPASNFDLRAKHDRAMYEWARTQEPGLVLVAGHTHRPVFARGTPDPPPTRSISELEAAPGRRDVRERRRRGRPPAGRAGVRAHERAGGPTRS